MQTKAQKKAYMLKWRSNNMDKVRKSQKEWCKKNRKRISEMSRKWNEKNREKYNKYRRNLHFRKMRKNPKYRELRRLQSARQKRKVNSTVSSRFYRTLISGKARVIFSNAVAKGKIIRPANCSNCLKPCTPHGHHPDYSKPLEVIWLCSLCHGARHTKS